ncbi:MAG: type IV-A pilus assembly ATPase PilB [Zoogloeaceae bacterium]|jgi:type IV pilus assembly protein PilB|nr:type IV-A pilus assembly ATPase PilB [Zoogloeaceae bacterium]
MAEDVAVTSNLTGLARALVQAGHLAEADAKAAVTLAKDNGTSFPEEVVNLQKISAPDLAKFTSVAFGSPLIDLATFDASYIPQNAMDFKLALTHRVVPLFKRGSRLSVATADPTNLLGLEAIRFQSGLTIDPVLAEVTKLIPLLRELTISIEDALKTDGGEEYDYDFDTLSASAETAAGDDVEDAPVVKFLQKILVDAINEGASDIHFEPYEKFFRIRFRVDGSLRDVARPPLVIKEKIASRLKIISRLNIAEKRVPQDGRTKMVLSNSRAIDFRVSSLPTMHGEKIVMRILDPTSASLGIEALGYEEEQKEVLMNAVKRPYGMVLVTGPTGSGKTVSLYTCLNILNKPGINISTAEDPAEISLAGINQVNVDDKAGLTFASALRAFLRQDPDIIMVGEIRDLETAEIAVKAAQTGHLVLSTLHTNDAPQTLTRLMNMGVPLFNIASSVLLITAQRLGRRLCSCKIPIDVPRQSLLNAGFKEEELDGSWTLFGPDGCGKCKGSGYKGRVGIYQVMPISEEIQRLTMAGATALDIANQAAKEGVKTLRESGLLKVKQGITSLDEVLNITND